MKLTRALWDGTSQTRLKRSLHNKHESSSRSFWFQFHLKRFNTLFYFYITVHNILDNPNSKLNQSCSLLNESNSYYLRLHVGLTTPKQILQKKWNTKCSCIVVQWPFQSCDHCDCRGPNDNSKGREHRLQRSSSKWRRTGGQCRYRSRGLTEKTTR